MKPYKLSPTQGTIPVEKIVGRGKDLTRLEKVLNSQSVVIEEVRRMGKTLFLKKYAHISHEHQKVMYFTLQGKKDVNELIDTLMKSLLEEQSFGKLRIGWNAIKKIYNSVKPEKVAIESISFKLPEFKNKWKDVLTACLEDIAKRDKKDKESLVIILDELPIMIWDWINNGKAEQAKEFLDVLRANRQLLEDTGKVRFVICGSIGMQVVLKKLKNEFNYTGEPFNDMHPFSLGAMDSKDASFLCKCLLLDDFKVDGNDSKETLITLICELSERLPFYINILFSIVQNEFESELNIENIKKAYNLLLNEPKFSKVLKQLDERITIYYSEEEAYLMKNILDFISVSKEMVTDKDIIEAVGDDKNKIKESLYTLHSENYLKKKYKDGVNTYSFKYKIMKEWWKINMS